MMVLSLAQATSPHVSGTDLILVPVGSLEQHGPHLPLETDLVIAEAVAHAAAQRLPGSRVAPGIPYGASGEHQSFPGTSSIGALALRQVVVELTRSMRTWARRVVFVNGHGGNHAALKSAVKQLVDEGHDVAWTSCVVVGADAHAGRTETSVMLHLAPQGVQVDLAVPGNVAPLRTLMPTMVACGVAAVSSNGVLGDPSGANAAEGRRILDAMTDRVVLGVRDARG
jgi:creatinine amidohydrolase